MQNQTELDNIHGDLGNRSGEGLRFLIELQDEDLGHKEAKDVEEGANKVENWHST